MKLTIYNSIESAIRWEHHKGCSLAVGLVNDVKSGRWEQIPAHMRETALRLLAYWFDDDLLRRTLEQHQAADGTIVATVAADPRWTADDVAVAVAIRAARQLPLSDTAEAMFVARFRPPAN